MKMALILFYVKLFIICVAPIAIACCVKLLTMYVSFKKSTYLEATGNKFWLTVFNTGVRGEFLTYKILEKIQSEYNGKILMNIYVPKEDGETTELDGIYINNTGVYVIESKNYSGWIFGSENNQNWTQLLNKKVKNQFYNPIRQNKGHIANLKKYIGDELKADAFISVIVFSERCELKKIDIKSNDVAIIKRNSLLNYLEKRCKTIESIVTNQEINHICELLRPLTNVKEEDKQQHIENIKSRISKKTADNIEPEKISQDIDENIINTAEVITKIQATEVMEDICEKLKAYRLKVSREEKIKPYMVFTNEQLSALNESKPKTKEELLKIKGFGEKKVEKYGDGILEIVNQHFEMN